MGSHGHREYVTNAAQGEAKLTSAVVASLVPFVLGIQLAKLSSRCFQAALITCHDLLLLHAQPSKAAGACSSVAPALCFHGFRVGISSWSCIISLPFCCCKPSTYFLIVTVHPTAFCMSP